MRVELSKDYTFEGAHRLPNARKILPEDIVAGPEC